jgi:hypothetical protein
LLANIDVTSPFSVVDGGPNPGTVKLGDTSMF